VRLHIERVDGMAGGHIDAVVLRTAEAEGGAALWQADVGERLSFRTEHHHAVEGFRLAPYLEHPAAADVSPPALQPSVVAPAAPQIAVAIDPETIERALVGGVDQLGAAAERAVVLDLIAPDAAIGRALPFDNVELLLVRREGEPIGIDDV